MIFRPESVEKILAGTKTQTRRVAKDVCRYRVGQAYSVQPGRGKNEVARVLVNAIRREKLIDMTPQDLVAEGFIARLDSPSRIDEARARFINVWTQLHGSYNAQQLVDVIDFTVVSKRG